mmetsp:Transcript_98172/g.194431  ORF Transcript_98172/g.194431 Transcript_98172/m.194431 type:complete len:260 (+) Transcript_98172:312-1091(+)
MHFDSRLLRLLHGTSKRSEVSLDLLRLLLDLPCWLLDCVFVCILDLLFLGNGTLALRVECQQLTSILDNLWPVLSRRHSPFARGHLRERVHSCTSDWVLKGVVGAQAQRPRPEVALVVRLLDRPAVEREPEVAGSRPAADRPKVCKAACAPADRRLTPTRQAKVDNLGIRWIIFVEHGIAIVEVAVRDSDAPQVVVCYKECSGTNLTSKSALLLQMGMEVGQVHVAVQVLYCQHLGIWTVKALLHSFLRSHELLGVAIS